MVTANGLWIVAASLILAAFSFSNWRAKSHDSRPASPPAGVAAWIASAEPLIILAIAPALLFPSPVRLGVLALVPVVAWANWRANGRAIPPTPLNACLFLLLAMTAVSLGATFDIRNSVGKISGVVLGTLVFWSTTRWTTSRPRLAMATNAFLLAGAALAVIGLLGTNWFAKFGFLGSILDRLPKAIRGVPGAEEGFQPNAVAGCLVLFIPLQIALLIREIRAGLVAAVAAVHGVLLALTAGTLVLTQSRGAWTGLIAALMVFLLVYRRATRIVAVVLLAGLSVLPFAVGPDRLANLVVSRSGAGTSHSVESRVELWSRAIDAIRDFPITGLGMNAFRRVMPQMYPTLDATPDLDVAHAHNHFLQAALDLGLPGLIAYSAIWIIVGVLLWRVYRRSDEPRYRTMAGGLGAGLIAHFTFGLADVIPLGSKVGVLFWLTLALAVSLHQVALTPTAVRPPARAL